MPLMIFLYFYYTWMILKFSDNIIYLFVDYRLLRYEITINIQIFRDSLKLPYYTVFKPMGVKVDF